MLSEKQLLTLKQEIETAKQSVAESRGHLSALMKQLSENWACPTVEKAEKKLAKMKTELETMLSEIEESSEKLEEKLENKDKEFDEEIESNKKAYSKHLKNNGKDNW